MWNYTVPVVAEMLNVAGWPIAMGLGDISTPFTLTLYSTFASTYKIKSVTIKYHNTHEYQLKIQSTTKKI